MAICSTIASSPLAAVLLPSCYYIHQNKVFR
jgi:hypothetical protein